MATYSYSKAQLDRRDQPAKPFWSFPKIAAAIGFSGVMFIGTCIALTPNQPAPVAVTPPAPVVVASPAETVQSKSSEEIWDEVRSLCADRGPWTIDITKCEENETKARVKAQPAPIPDARWDSRYQQWSCPADYYAESYYPCSKGNVISKEEFDQNTRVTACVGRAGKNEGSSGESWAYAQCRANSNFF